MLLCSVIALVIIGERLWSLRQNVVLPKNMLAHTIQAYRHNGATPQLLSQLAATAPLGQILAAGLRNEKHSPAIMKEAIEESSHVVAIDLERVLTCLGTIAAISPLRGLFGTTVGLIEMFSAQTPTGHNPVQLAHGISVALYNTAFGLVVAVPSMVFLPLLPHQGRRTAGRHAHAGGQAGRNHSRRTGRLIRHGIKIMAAATGQVMEEV